MANYIATYHKLQKFLHGNVVRISWVTWAILKLEYENKET